VFAAATPQATTVDSLGMKGRIASSPATRNTMASTQGLAAITFRKWGMP
jgi:hypothetical protein